MDGVNYLMPVDARLARDTDVRYETVTLDDVVASTLGATLRIVVLDACRDNPLVRSMQRTGATRSISRGSFEDPDPRVLVDEILVAYAAAAGTTAADGSDRHSPYTAALLSHLEEPLEILTLFRRVRRDVLAATNGLQRPHEYQSLVEAHYLAGAQTQPPGAQPDVPDRLLTMAVQGHVSSQTDLGERYAAGHGVVQSDAEAVRWFREAADQGYAPAQAALGDMYASGRGIDQNDKVAVSWYSRAAEQNDSRAMSALGVMYRDGRGVRQENKAAVKLFRFAAERGYADGQVNLGWMYDTGRGVRKNLNEAIEWYRRAAQQGNPDGQVNLGWMYDTGRGVRYDVGEAVQWYRRAAEQGSAHGQYHLGWDVRARSRCAVGSYGSCDLVSESLRPRPR